MRNLFKVFLATLLLSPGLALYSAATGQKLSKPNIIIILADDLGAGDLGCSGATKIKTPNIDRLAAEGVRFTQGYAPSATCTPSRYSLLTGEYAWRQKAKTTSILDGDAPLCIEPGRFTLPEMLRQAGYATGVVGKWHLGLGDGTAQLDFNGEVKPGPREIGFDYSFIIPATVDRVPSVWIENHRVAGLEPTDPIMVSYVKNISDTPTGLERPDLLKQGADKQHSCSITNGISRIGYMKGGHAARFKDEELASTVVAKSVAFIEQRKGQPFFLSVGLFEPHVPRVAEPPFVGTSGSGVRGDVIQQADWQVGEILNALDRLDLAENTLVIFSSDNGPILFDGYYDRSVEDLNGHNPTGGLRGWKYLTFEGGCRVPFIVRWPEQIKPRVSGQLISLVDVFATLANIAGYEVPPQVIPDSLDLTDVLLGRTEKNLREHTVLHGIGGRALRSGDWKYIPATAATGGIGSGANAADERFAAANISEPLLFNLALDPNETTNVIAQHPEKAQALARQLSLIEAETVGVFFDAEVEQIRFAAGDVKAALESNKYRVEMLPESSLTASYPNKKVVLALASNATVSAALAAQGGSQVTGLGEQAFGLRTTETPQKSYWALGGDANGAMYGGLQMAENIQFNRFAGSYNGEESPAILNRGIKLNLPFDRESLTYGRAKATGINHAIHHVWDMAFWTTWLDEMARHRYNVLSIWNNHPFTSMIKLPDYPDVAIQDVTDFDGKKRVMSLDEKIGFWRKVMAYAKLRGFEFYLVNWNIWTDGATGKYGITDDRKMAATSPETIAYMRKCMTTLLETYPDLDGFGITQGEHMSDNDADNSVFLGKTFGLGMADYARSHPERELTFIHRWHLADFATLRNNFRELLELPNVKFEMSYKYSLAHMYSAALPQRMDDKQIKPLRENNLRSWLTVRNDDFYYHNWGDPDFARAYIQGMFDKGDWFVGFNMGSDGNCPTRTFFSKHSVTQGLLEVQRQWYMFMLWGRLSYNPATADTVFQNHLARRYPEVSSESLFTAWARASSGFPKIGDLITGTLGRDNQWWPEACQSEDGFLTVADFGEAKASKGSALGSIAETASGQLNGRKSAYAVADEIEADALAALALVTPMKAPANSDLGVAINNIKAMSYLTLYYAQKIRGAIQVQAQENEKARDALGSAYSWWMQYSNLMDSMYHGMAMARTADLPHWHAHDPSVLKEFTDLGGAIAAEATRPNILFAIADDWGRHAGAYGTPWVQTPAFDRIAREGLLFQNAFTPMAKCAPSRAIVLTGRHLWQNEEAGNHLAYFPTKFQSWPETLMEKGWHVGITGKGWGPGIANDPSGKPRLITGQPFNGRKTEPATRAMSTNDYAANFTDFLDAAPKDTPWCFWYGSHEPHREYEFQSGANKGGKNPADIDRVPAYWPDNETVRHDMLDYALEIEHSDQHLGRMIAELEKRGLLDTTLIIVSSDHGMPFPRAKGYAYPESNRVPLAVRWPSGMKHPGRNIEDFVDFTDIAPTILDYAGIAWKDSDMMPITGKSWRPILQSAQAGRVLPERDHVLIGKERNDVGRPHNWGYPIRGISTAEYLYLHNYEPSRWPAGNPETGYLDTDGSPTKSLILELGRANRGDRFWQLNFGMRPADELYDLRTDRDCVHNLAADPAQGERLAALRARMETMLKAQGDPRMEGRGAVFDHYKPTAGDGLYEKFMRGEAVKTGWVNPTDFEKEPIQP